MTEARAHQQRHHLPARHFFNFQHLFNTGSGMGVLGKKVSQSSTPISHLLILYPTFFLHRTISTEQAACAATVCETEPSSIRSQLL
ncbi:MAG: hypothetical protein QOF61_2437 [Acidobacteriota bacterium]|nr:hypothetical protein [Acidobacteriota bacterium]